VALTWFFRRGKPQHDVGGGKGLIAARGRPGARRGKSLREGFLAGIHYNSVIVQEKRESEGGDGKEE